MTNQDTKPGRKARPLLRAAVCLSGMLLFGASLHAQSAAQPAAQQRLTVTGIVSGNGSPMAGVTVVVQGTTLGTATDRNGVYKIVVQRPDTSSLVFNYLGMKTATVKIQSRQVVDVTLEQEVEQIEQVVITGYHTVSADTYTGSAKVISADQIGTRAIATIEEALRGISPGTLVAESGQPGEQNEVLLRGVGSMNADNQPLYVVDGVVWDQVNQTGDSSSPSNPINALNPSDIVNITELKDAASAALYGSRGANGVIVITTKSGRENEKPKFAVNLQSGFAVMNVYPEMTNGQQFSELWVEAEFNRLIQHALNVVDNTSQSRIELVKQLTNLYNDKTGYTVGDQRYNYYQWMKVAQGRFNDIYAMPLGDGTFRNYDYFAADRDKLPSVDWFKEISRPAPFVKANVSVSGGSSTMRYYGSAEYFDQQGTIINSQLKRYSMRMKLSSELEKQLVNWGISTYMASSVQTGPQSGSESFNSPQYAAVMVPSVVAPRLEDGSYNFYFPNNLLNSNNNPLSIARENVNERPLLSLTAQGWIQLNLLPWLKFKSTNSLYYTQVRRHAYYSREFGTGLLTNGLLNESDSHSRKLTSTNLFTVSKTWKARHRLNVVAGSEFEDQRNTYNRMSVTNFASDSKPYASMGSQISGWTGGGSGFALFSLLSSADYSYRHRYFLSASYRMDSSSRFSPDKRTGHFWSVAGGWGVHNEEWFKNLNTPINYLRFKGSYGVNGTLPLNLYLWRDGYKSSNYMGTPGAAQLEVPRDLTWEGNRIWNTGLDIRFFSSRLRLSAEYYERKSKDLLQDVRVSMGSGYQTMLMNTSAGINNRGVEIEVIGRPLVTKKQNLEISFNIATLKSTYYGLADQELDAYSRQLMANGKSVYSWYLRESGGVDPATGLILYPHFDEDGNKYFAIGTTGVPFEIVGQGLPKVSGGFSIKYSYGNWMLSTLCSYAWGYQIYDRLAGQIIETDGSSEYSAAVEQLDRWTPDNIYATSPLRLREATNMTSTTTRFLKKGDYLKIRNIKLSYTFPQRWMKKLHISSATVFVQADNPFIFSHIPGYDPELSLSGYRYTDRYPTASTYTGGLSINF